MVAEKHDNIYPSKCSSKLRASQREGAFMTFLISCLIVGMLNHIFI